MSDAGVTVTGAHSKTVTVDFPSAVQAAIAQQLANAIDAARLPELWCPPTP